MRPAVPVRWSITLALDRVSLPSLALRFVVAFVAGAVLAMAACAGGRTTGGAPGDGAGPSATGCTLCVTNADCPSGICAQVGGDAYCVPACDGRDACPDSRACAPVVTVEGAQESACAPAACAPDPATPPGVAGGTACAGFAGPDTPAPCHACGTRPCQKNGCYGGWDCNTATSTCQPAPATCTGSADGGSPRPFDAGGPVEGSVGPNGGTLSRLFFAVVGDTRPPVINDTPAYPVSVIDGIYRAVETTSPRPPFVVASGDYVFSSADGTQAVPQLDLYLKARAHYSGLVLPAMGNHECTGAVTSNCGPGTADGLTANYQAFVSKLLAPIGKSGPNYAVEVDAIDGSWTSKLVFVAGNAWTDADATWLDSTLAKPTTYTFIVRHEPKEASQAPGCRASETIMASHPYTLAIVGHTHTYGRTGPRQVTIGNGGAPLVGSKNYGFGLVQQRSDGAIQVDMIDLATGQPDIGFRFALRADGSAAP